MEGKLSIHSSKSGDIEKSLDLALRILIFPIVTLSLNLSTLWLPGLFGWIPFLLNSLL